MQQDTNKEFEKWWYECITWMSTLTDVEYLNREQVKNIAHSAWNESRRQLQQEACDAIVNILKEL